VGLWVLGGLLSFMMIDKIVRIVHQSGGHGHSHGHSHGQKEKVNKTDKSDKKDKKDKKDKNEKKNNDDDDDDVSTHHDHTSPPVSAVAAYLNLIADFSHNITDGLAVGASFRASHSLGVITTLAVLLHELPHEIGDFAILIQAGFTKKQAMIAQLYTAVGAMVGAVIGLSAEGYTGSPWILPFTAGGFIYIATTSVLPSLLEGESLEWRQSLLECLGIVFGVVLMLLVGLLE